MFLHVIVCCFQLLFCDAELEKAILWPNFGCFDILLVSEVDRDYHVIVLNSRHKGFDE